MPRYRLDPISGSAAPSDPGVPQQWPRGAGSHNEVDFPVPPPTQHSPDIAYSVGNWVTMRGGEYFFVASRSFSTGG